MTTPGTSPPSSGGNASSAGAAITASTSQKGSTRHFDIPFLEENGGNYIFWKHRVQMILEIRELWPIVIGADPCPDSTTSPDAHAEWICRDREARAQIMLTLRDEPLNNVLAVTTAKESWEELSVRYEGKGEQKLLQLINEVFRSTLSDAEPLGPQINTVTRAACAAANLGLSLEDKLIATALISSLPSSLSTLKTILSNTPPSQLTVKEITSRILLDEQTRIQESGVSATAFFARAAKKGKSKDKSGDKRKKKCTHCHKLGHEVGECRKLKREQEAKGNTAPKATPSSGTNAAAPAKAAVATTDETVCVYRALAADEVIYAQRTQAELLSVHNTSTWIIDSGASRTMSSHREWFQTFTVLSKPIPVFLGDNRAISGTGVGRILVRMHTANSSHQAILQDVLYVPELHGNLLSIAHLTERRADIYFTGTQCQILSASGDITCIGHRRGANLYVMDMASVVPPTARIAVVDSLPTEGEEVPALEAFGLAARTSGARADIHTWHRRLGHLNPDAILRMSRHGLVSGLLLTGDAMPTHQCEPCLKGKQTRAEIRKSTETRADTVLGRVFSDVCGPLPTRSHAGFSYFVTFIDDFSRRVHVVGLKEKSEVEHHLKAFITRVELETGFAVKVLRTDGGGEYTSNRLAKYLEDKGIKHELTTPDTPQHNGVAERMNRTLLDKVRAMLADADLPESYWYAALEYASHLHNVVPTRALDDLTPEEAWSGNKPDISAFRIFGSRAYVHIPDKHRSKLAAKSPLHLHWLCQESQGISPCASYSTFY
jgi:transposase InsO family protein